MPRTSELNPLDVYVALGRPIEAAKQKPNGSYGNREAFSKTKLFNHLTGVSTFAFCPLFYHDDRKYARFLCWDIDTNGPERRRILVEILRKYPELQDQWPDRVIWCATGSDPGRCKVIFPLRKPLLQVDAVQIVNAVWTEAQGNLLWGAEDEHTTSTFPQNETGGIVRILGRNIGRTQAGHLDQALDMYGKPTDLAGVVKALDYLPDDRLLWPVSKPICPPKSRSLSTTKTLSTTNYARISGKKESSSGKTPVQERGYILRTTPHTDTAKNTQKHLSYLAKAVILSHGKAEAGRQEYVAAVRDFRTQVPADKKSVLRQIDTRADFTWDENCVWMKDVAISKPRLVVVSDWRPLEKSAFKAPKGRLVEDTQWSWYDLLTGLVHENGWNPHAFYVGYRTLGERVGRTDYENIKRGVDTAEKRHLFFRLERATGVRDLATMYTLVGQRETLQEAFDKGLASPEYQERLAQLKARGREPSPQKVVNGYLWYPPKSVETNETALPKAA
jgi:hypothetical protein